MDVIKKFHNKHGEKISIKYINGNTDILYVHHTDCTDDYITLLTLITQYIIDEDELTLIMNEMEKLRLELKNK